MPGAIPHEDAVYVVPRNNLGLYDVRDFVLSSNSGLTIADIARLRPGDEIKVLVIDRNMEETAEDANSWNTAVDAPQFFRNNWAVYTHTEGLKGQILFGWQTQPLDFEFHLEWESRKWYPVTQGCLPARDPQGFSAFEFAGPKHFSSFPPSTRVGWRGPMVLWSGLHAWPRVWKTRQ